MKKFVWMFVGVFYLICCPFVMNTHAAVTASYPNVSNQSVTFDGYYDAWDLNQCDLEITYTLDMSAYVPCPMWNTAWSSVGVNGSASGWASSGAPGACETDPNNLDIDDKFNLGAPNRYDETSYDVSNGVVVGSPIGNPWSNYGFWFDRDGVDPYQPNLWGAVDGGTYNTGGVYAVKVVFHAISDTQGYMAMEVNGVKQGFFDTWKNAQPDYYPVGKTLTGSDLTKLQVFASVWGEGVTASNITATGCRGWSSVRIDVKSHINLKSKGKTPVALFGSAGLDVYDVDLNTVEFACASVANFSYEDNDGDGFLDLILKFNTQELCLTEGQNEAMLIADTLSGGHLKGTDEIVIAPNKKK